MKTFINIIFAVAFMGAGCACIFASIFLVMGGDTSGGIAFVICAILSWFLMVVNVNDAMMENDYPSSFTGKRKTKGTPSQVEGKAFDVVATGSCGVEPIERDMN